MSHVFSRTRLGLAVVLAASSAAATPVAAAQAVYSCTLSVPPSQNWVPDQIVLLRDDARGMVKINDSVIYHFLGHPVDGVAADAEGGAQHFVWTLRNIPAENGRVAVDFAYSARLAADGRAITVTARPIGFARQFLAKGECRLT